MKKKTFLISLACALLLGASAIPADAYVKAVWFNASDSHHKVVSGQDAVLKVVCDNPNAAKFDVAGPMGYSDSNVPVVYDTTLKKDNYGIEYTVPSQNVATGTYTITVKDGDGTSLGFDTFTVKVLAAPTTNDLKEIAIADGLWFLHSKMNRSLISGVKVGDIDHNYDPGTVMCGQAFVDAGHLATGNANNPYTETVQRIVNFTTNKLAIISFTLSPKDGNRDPENRSNGKMVKDYLGVYFIGNETEYGFGPALKFLATCGYGSQKPALWDDTLNHSGLSVSIGNWTFPQIMQQMVDFIVWAQLYQKGNNYDNGTPYPVKVATPLAPGSIGGWPYYIEGWGADPADNANLLSDFRRTGTYGDVSITWWTIQGLMAAESKGCSYPTYVKPDLTAFLTARQDPATGEFTFGPAKFFHLIERTGQGLALLKWVNVPASDKRVTKARDFIVAKWNKHTYAGGQNHPDQSQLCHDQKGEEVQCYSHFFKHRDDERNDAGLWTCQRGWPSANWDASQSMVTGYTFSGNDCQFVATQSYDDLNIHAFRTITDGFKAYGFTTVPSDVPTFAPVDFMSVYTDLLLYNQFTNGGWDDRAWITGNEMGTAWAISTLKKL